MEKQIVLASRALHLIQNGNKCKPTVMYHIVALVSEYESYHGTMHRCSPRRHMPVTGNGSVPGNMGVEHIPWDGVTLTRKKIHLLLNVHLTEDPFKEPIQGP